MNLQVTHRFDAAGTVRLRCLGDVDQYVTNTRIVAVRAGHLINRQVGGAEYNYGSGSPRIISAFRDDGGTFGSSGADRWPRLRCPQVPGCSQPSSTSTPAVEGIDALCKLTAGSAVDQVNVALDETQRSIMSLVGAHTFGAGGGTVRLTCRSAPDFPRIYPIHAYWIKLTAIQASGLTQKVL